MNEARWLWGRQTLRRRWRAVVVLSLLIALAGGVAMAAATGARRSTVVVHETLRDRRQADVLSLPSQEGFDWSEIVALPYVEAYGLVAVSGMCLAETGGLDDDRALCGQPQVAGGIFDTIQRVDVLDGRMPTAPNEIAINRLAIERYGFGIGDRLHLDTVGAGRLGAYWSGEDPGGQPWGPRFEVTVTGVVAGEDAWRLISGGIGHPGFIMSTSFIPAYGDQLEYRADAFLRLRGGEADIPQLRQDMARITGQHDLPIRNVHEARRRVEDRTSLEANGLWLFAVALMAAASVLIGQAVMRLIRAGAGDAPALRALGMAGRGVAATLAVPGLVVAAGGAVGAVLVAVIVSPRFPIGMARTFDRRPGVKVDVPVLAVGAIALLAVIAAISIASALVAARAGRPAPMSPERAARTDKGLPLPLPLPAALGVRIALERRSVGGAVPVRPGLAGVVVAVAAVVAAVTFRSGLDDALTHPQRGGRSWDFELLLSASPDAIAADPDIARAGLLHYNVVNLDGWPVAAHTVEAIADPIDVVILDGRIAAAADEIAVGPATADVLELEIGDEVPGGPEGTLIRVVGTAFMPETGGHSSYDEGVWATPDGFARLSASSIDQSRYLIDVRDGADVGAVLDRMVQAGGSEYELTQPAGVETLKGIRVLPDLLAGLLVVLGVGAVGHTLVLTARRRRIDLAVLRALGLSRRQLRAAVAWQAATMAVIGVVLGVPLGILAGRLAWQWLATSMPLVYVPPLALLATALIVPAAFAVLLLTAVGPARSAARLRPAAALRVE